MNCDKQEALSLATEISGMFKDEVSTGSTVILAPPFVHIGSVSQLLKESPIAIAAQNCSSENSGAFTGEVSATMIASVGASWVIIGHSERRMLFGETNELIRKKTDKVLDAGLSLIFCCGETLEQRDSGIQSEVIKTQLNESLFHLSADMLKRIVIAYEPVWAIGTGKTASPEQAQDMHAFIRHEVKVKYGDAISESMPILYGGSCNESNAVALFALKDVDGGLIGGASLKSRSFINIVRSLPQ